MGIYIWNYYDLTKEKVSTGMVDEKVTVISSFLTWQFFVMEAGNAIAALGLISMKVTVIFSTKRSKVNHIVTVILFGNSMA
jgi:hypothetical protein